MPSGTAEHQRARVVGLLDDVGHLQFQHVAAERLVGHAVPFLVRYVGQN